MRGEHLNNECVRVCGPSQKEVTLVSFFRRFFRENRGTGADLPIQSFPKLWQVSGRVVWSTTCTCWRRILLKTVEQAVPLRCFPALRFRHPFEQRRFLSCFWQLESCDLPRKRGTETDAQTVQSKCVYVCVCAFFPSTVHMYDYTHTFHTHTYV